MEQPINQHFRSTKRQSEMLSPSPKVLRGDQPAASVASAASADHDSPQALANASSQASSSINAPVEIDEPMQDPCATQPQDSQEGWDDDPDCDPPAIYDQQWLLHDANGLPVCGHLQSRTVFGRKSDGDEGSKVALKQPTFGQLASEDEWLKISRSHFALEPMISSGSIRLQALSGPTSYRRCDDAADWAVLASGEMVELMHNDHLIKAHKHLTLRLAAIKTGPCLTTAEPECQSFDEQYLKLISIILKDGEANQATKGPHTQAPRPHMITVDLGIHSQEYFLPLTSLRRLNFRHVASEALWYLRGEEHIGFLKQHKNPFWNDIADDDGFVGLNYGLLVKFPLDDGGTFNQLEQHVIAKLVDGASSRNMTCTLHKPGELTKQSACTSTCSFVCRAADGAHKVEYLDMMLHQRSSDVAVGLVWDVAVWALILHLVCREVRMRTQGQRNLRAGRLAFNLVNAHIYDKNVAQIAMVSQRMPLASNRPMLILDEKRMSGKSLFDIAKDNESPSWLQIEDYQAHPAINFTPAKDESRPT